ncbi:MAG: hypothetical protein ACI8TX_003042 [Hyphomicrobiaceae bacterium]|jgi:hypothetical protein
MLCFIAWYRGDTKNTVLPISAFSSATAVVSFALTNIAH